MASEISKKPDSSASSSTAHVVDIHHNPFIQILLPEDPLFFRDLPNIDLDKMLVATGKANYLATNGLGASFAICALGQTKRRIPVLSLWHRSPASTYSFQNGMQILKRRMIENECVPESIEVFAIGGQNLNAANDDEGTAQAEEEILGLSERENIRGVLFNYSGGEGEPLDVVLTPERIHVSKIDVSNEKRLFQSSEKNEDAGDLLDEDLNALQLSDSDDDDSIDPHDFKAG